jgi:hypothetical protein
MKKNNSLNQFKEGAKIAPPYLIFAYILFVGLDIYTTYLASPYFNGPDLKHESNIIIQYFRMTWSQVIVASFIAVLLIVVLFSLSLNYLDSYYQQLKGNHFQPTNIKLLYKKLIACYIILSLFYSHFIYSLFVSFNNYLGYIHGFKIENSFTKISSWYINIVTINQPYFHLYFQLLSFLLAIVITIIKVKRIKKNYESF